VQATDRSRRGENEAVRELAFRGRARDGHRSIGAEVLHSPLGECARMLLLGLGQAVTVFRRCERCRGEGLIGQVEIVGTRSSSILTWAI